MKWALKLSQNCEMWHHQCCWYKLILYNMIPCSLVDMYWSCEMWHQAVLIHTDLVQCDALVGIYWSYWGLVAPQVWGRSSTLITQATCSSEIHLHIYQTTWCYRPRRHLHVDKVLLMLLVTNKKYSFKLEDFFQTTVLRGYAVVQLVEALC